MSVIWLFTFAVWCLREEFGSAVQVLNSMYQFGQSDGSIHLCMTQPKLLYWTLRYVTNDGFLGYWMDSAMVNCLLCSQHYKLSSYCVWPRCSKIMKKWHFPVSNVRKRTIQCLLAELEWWGSNNIPHSLEKKLCIATSLFKEMLTLTCLI